MPLILKKPRNGMLAFPLGTAAALRETNRVIEQRQEQLKAERKQHAFKLAEKEREIAELRYELASRDTHDAFAQLTDHGICFLPVHPASLLIVSSRLF